MKTLFILCLYTALLFSLSSCNEHLEGPDATEATDDATLLASQLKLLQTRATNATNTILITTAKSVNFKVENSSPIIVNWGDGNNDIDVFAHTYTDDLPVHTICFNGAQDALAKFECPNQELIFLDVTKDTSLTRLHCNNNRISQLNLGHNIKLEYLDCSRNKLDSIDVSNLFELLYLECAKCNLEKIDVSNNLKLFYIGCSSNFLTQINLSSNSLLKQLYVNDNQIKKLDLTNNTLIKYLFCINNNLTDIILPPSSPSLFRMACENNHLNNLILPTSCPNLTVISCENNDFFFDPDPDVTFSKLLALVSSLPQKTTGSGLISVSETTDTEMIKAVAKRKNWSLVTK